MTAPERRATKAARAVVRTSLIVFGVLSGKCRLRSPGVSNSRCCEKVPSPRPYNRRQFPIDKSVTYQRPIRSYVLRQGRFSPAQQRAVENLMPRYGVPYRAEALRFPEAFGRDAPVVAEIGFGMGETTARIAAANPGTDYLAIEVHGPGVGSLLKRLEAESIA